ncbi:sigma 54-interacting transcriptional regulator [Lewinella sp. IMCC34183]|uniref:sigma 54-interacting transcriptional regulator n=1 Tax=Lewinella sp. IMCC34183 TaxID=2248762 RepID=UPI0013008CDF|nr:sigma-54 dependent transcriptional regulator [Lewinella sp. IMCC34183]
MNSTYEQLFFAPESVADVAALSDGLQVGECVIKPITLGRRRHHTLHLTILSVGDFRYLCCMLLPGSDPSETRLSEILDRIESLILQSDVAGNLTYLNARARQVLGLTGKASRLPMHLRDVQVDFSPDSFAETVSSLTPSGIARLRSHFRHTDGSEIPVEVSMVASQHPGDAAYVITAWPIADQLADKQTLGNALLAANRDWDGATRETERLRSEYHYPSADPPLVFRSDAFQRVINRVEQVAPTDIDVLITGESGTGKSVVAQTIHRLSGRADQAFISLDCSSPPAELLASEFFSYPKGAFTGAFRDRVGRVQAADGGTLYLSNIEELPLPLQAQLKKLIDEERFIPMGEQEKVNVDVRLVVSPIAELAEATESGRFRRDLYVHLSEYSIDCPPLRRRPEDIPVLIDHFLARFNQECKKPVSGVDDSTLVRLMKYEFPGNVAELESMVERAFIVGKKGTIELPESVLPTDGSYRPVLDLFDGRLTEFLPLADYQKKYIELVLESTGGRVSGKNGAAEIMKVNPQTLFSKMKRLGIKR